jgi:hypothetical protein
MFFTLQIQIYTVTKSGIVSANRTEEYMRIEPPSGNFSLQEVTKTSANLNIDLMTSSADLPDCVIRFKTTDSNGTIVNERSMPLASRAIPITLGNLTPYQKYSCQADIVCGQPTDKVTFLHFLCDLFSRQDAGDKELWLLAFAGLIAFLKLEIDGFCLFAYIVCCIEWI